MNRRTFTQVLTAAALGAVVTLPPITSPGFNPEGPTLPALRHALDRLWRPAL